MNEAMVTRVSSLFACVAAAYLMGHKYGFEVGVVTFFVLGLLSDIKFGIGKP